MRPRMKKKHRDRLPGWSIVDSIELYGIHRWSQGIFSVNAGGNLCLRARDGREEIDLKALVDAIRLRGLQLPVLIRFTDILRRRLDQICSSFAEALEEYEYEGGYRGVYPIKVNQHRHVLEDIVQEGRRHHFGLECGSKPELLIATAYLDDPDALIVCNGFKDRDYVEAALYASRLGPKVFLVLEKLSELELILKVAREIGVEPRLGIRMKLASRGKGMWEASGGDRSKFGLFAEEIVEAIATLKRRRRLGWLQLLHFHLGSQISDIQRIKEALREAASFFVEISRLGAPIGFVDVGGGLAVDYDGSRTNFASSANYEVPEYADDVVNAFSMACDASKLPHPTLITEAGRALVAYHSVLVMEVLGESRVGRGGEPPRLPRGACELETRMAEIMEGFSGKNFQGTYHDAVEARREALMLFSLRRLTLKQRALVERYFWAICTRILRYVRQLDYFPDELEGLEQLLSTTYYCNFSLFQSLPDHWAVRQLFPVVPLHRHDEEPTERGILADITCDSDGVMQQFVDLRDVQDTLPLHPLRPGEPYCLGIFLVGAYQEILGDLHNLFGDTHVVHVSSGEGGYAIDKTVEGDSIIDALNVVQFQRRELLARFRKQVEKALRNGSMILEESAPFMRKVESALDEYTYLRRDHPVGPGGSGRKGPRDRKRS